MISFALYVVDKYMFVQIFQNKVSDGFGAEFRKNL